MTKVLFKLSVELTTINNVPSKDVEEAVRHALAHGLVEPSKNMPGGRLAGLLVRSVKVRVDTVNISGLDD